MVIMGSDGLNWTADCIDERLSKGRWPTEARRLQTLRKRAKLLMELVNEALQRVTAYEEKLAVKFRIGPCPVGLMSELRPGGRPALTRRRTRSSKKVSARKRGAGAG